MDLLHPLLHGFPRHAGDFIAEHGPLVASLTAILFTLVEVVATLRGRRRRKPHSFFEYVRAFGLMISILLVTGLGLYAVYTKWMPKPQEIVWKEQIDRTLRNCIDKIEPRKREFEQKLIRIYESPRLHCLAHAVQRARAADPTVSASTSPAAFFRAQIKRADAFITVKGVAEILRITSSIDEKQFLGYGYSLPYSPAASARYSDAVTHEYLIRNRCVTWNSSLCAEPKQISRQVFTWILDSEEISKDPNEKIGKLLARKPPVSREESQKSPESKESFDSYLKDIVDHDRLKKNPPVLVRFARFSRSAYYGTVGRPNATYVFFSNLAEVWDKSIFEAERASGRQSDPLSAIAGQSVFIWVYFPSEDDDARPASWENVLHFLDHEIRVDPEIARLAD